MPKKQYTNESITSLKGADRVRKRPAVIFGSDGIEGCRHTFVEILSNSIDEAKEGYGKKIVVTRFNDGYVEVTDFGRGTPVDFNTKENRFNWELIYCELYAGGKYADNGDNYEYSLGLNGLGLCATQYASERMEVEIFRDGFRYTLEFKKGENVGGLFKEPTTQKQTGTRTKWKPDIEVFTDINISAEFITETMDKQAIVNKGIKFIFKNQLLNGSFETKEFFYENGIADYINILAGETAFTEPVVIYTERSGRDREDKPEYKVKIETAFCFSNKVQNLEYFHNSSYLEYGGSPEKAVKSAFVSAFDAYIKQINKYNKNESKITFVDVQECLILISNTYSTITSYENQTKKAITNVFIQQAMTDFLKAQLEVWFKERPQEATRVAEQLLANKRSRENAEKSRQIMKIKLTGAIDITNRIEKFVDCRSKDVSLRELYIVEGDSALGSCKQGRDADFQAIMPVRGKILNCLKADYDKIFKSEIITNLIKVLGCGVEVKLKNAKDLASFDLNNLRWNKVIICTDADVDGYQIRTLILTMIYRLFPTLINEGYVYIAETPLYEINCKGESYFAYDEAEKQHILNMLGDVKVSISRSKGLGENEPDMMWLTTMNPKTRRLTKITPEDAAVTDEIFSILLGDDLSGRKDYIAEYGADYLDDLDLS